MKNSKIVSIAALFLFCISFSSCFKDLDLQPVAGINSAAVYEDPESYVHILAKLYAGLNLTGNEGPSGNQDLVGLPDEGFSSYTRVFWNIQELSTDEVKCAWGDTGIPELNKMIWSPSNSFVIYMYYRIFFQITLCNEFIYQSSDEKMDEHGFTDADKQRISGYRNEARFLRALSYYHAMDIFGNVPFVTDEDQVGAFIPEQISRADLFSYVESELIAIETLLPAPQTNEYARADKACVWTLLAKIYLNAKVFTGTERYSDCATWASKVITEGGYTLQPVYGDLFKADNHNSNEIIFPVTSDGVFTQSFGCTTFLTHAAIAGTGPMADIDSAYFGVTPGWGGNRATPEFAAKFPDTDDSRNLFFTDGQTLVFSSDADLSNFTIGYAVAKWRNVTSTGEVGSDETYVDTDFPMFRLADVLLMYAECAARGSADPGLGTSYVNQLRERAYGDALHNVASITPESVLDERARELYWEGYRRTDLVRYGLFTGGGYIWSFKGGSFTGGSVDEHLNLYPLPTTDLVANPNLQQNTGY